MLHTTHRLVQYTLQCKYNFAAKCPLRQNESVWGNLRMKRHQYFACTFQHCKPDKVRRLDRCILHYIRTFQPRRFLVEKLSSTDKKNIPTILMNYTYPTHSLDSVIRCNHNQCN